MNHIDELKKMNLPADEFAIFGSGPMAIRGIKENKDLDIIVKPRLWNFLSSKYPPVNNGKTDVIKIGDIEFFDNWKPWFDNANELIETADVIGGIRFVKLDLVVEWKSQMAREKDIKDIELIRVWQDNNTK